MNVEHLAADNPRDVLRALRRALNGSGPAVALGGPLPEGTDPPAGTAVVLTTSGSTGVPKSVVLSRHALVASAMATAARIGEGAWLLPVSASYIAGVQVLVRALVQGREPAILSGRFSAAAFAHAASGMRSSRGGTPVPAYTSLVPAQLQTLVEAAEQDRTVASALGSFEAILVGGQALPVALRERAAALGARIVRTYGSTETAGGCVYDARPLDDVRVAEVDGELRISGPVLADGYLGDTERTAAAFITDETGVRWYRTGDAGAVSDGIVTVTGRIDNVIVSGGINISLDRVERVVRELPGLGAAVVVPVPDERWGQASVIVAERGAASAGSARAEQQHAGGRDAGAAACAADTADGHDAPAGDLLALARDTVARELGRPARPAGLLLVDDLPRLPSGKPDRRALAERARADRG